MRSKHLRHFYCFCATIVNLNFSNRRWFSFTTIKWFYCFFSTASVNRWSYWTLRFILRLYSCLEFTLKTFLNWFCLYLNLFLYFDMHFLNHLFLNNCNLFINMQFNLWCYCFIYYLGHLSSDGVLLWFLVLHILIYILFYLFFIHQ